MEASGAIYNWNKMPLRAFPVGFECCTCSHAAGLIAVWSPEPTKVTGSRGKCDPGWQMEHTLLCRGSLKEKWASVPQPIEASLRLPISGSRVSHEVFPKDREADGSKGHISRHSHSSKAWRCPFQQKGSHRFSPPVFCGCAGSISAFPTVASAAHPDLGRSSDFGSRPALLEELV